MDRSSPDLEHSFTGYAVGIRSPSIQHRLFTIPITEVLCQPHPVYVSLMTMKCPHLVLPLYLGIGVHQQLHQPFYLRSQVPGVQR